MSQLQELHEGGSKSVPLSFEWGMHIHIYTCTRNRYATEENEVSEADCAEGAVKKIDYPLNQISSSFSMPTFLTMGFQIFAGIHAGAFLGFFTCFRSPVKICTFFVPRSLSRISFTPLLAAFNAACLGDFPLKTPSSLPLASLRAKFLGSFSAVNIPPVRKCVCRYLLLRIYRLLITLRSQDGKNVSYGEPYLRRGMLKFLSTSDAVLRLIVTWVSVF